MSYIKKLSSGYWHYRPNREQFVQWPRHRAPCLDDCFPRGWATEQLVRDAESAAPGGEGEHRMSDRTRLNVIFWLMLLWAVGEVMTRFGVW